MRRLLRALESLFGDDRFAIHIIASEKTLDIEVGLCFCHLLLVSISQEVSKLIAVSTTRLFKCVRSFRLSATSDFELAATLVLGAGVHTWWGDGTLLWSSVG